MWVFDDYDARNIGKDAEYQLKIYKIREDFMEDSIFSKLSQRNEDVQ